MLCTAGAAAVVLAGSRLLSARRPQLGGGFQPPDAAERKAALGSVNGLPKPLAKAFDPADHFEPIPAPKPGEWLAEHHEDGQTYDQFVASRPNKPDARRRTIYLLPLGDFDADWSPHTDDLVAVAKAFFTIDVQALPPKPIDPQAVTVRARDGGRRQYLAPDFLRLLKTELPADGYCVLGVTMVDLYPEPKWNYVFGLASLRDRVGIYSFARYDPLFWNEKRSPEGKAKLLVRSLGVLLHETCHMFGMAHCVHYRCLVNGSNSLAESDTQPPHLCPVCLRKLHHATGCDPVARDRNLLREYRRLKVDQEAGWLERRLKHVEGA